MKVMVVTENLADMKVIEGVLERAGLALAAIREMITAVCQVDENTPEGLRAASCAFETLTTRIIQIYPSPQIIERDARGLATMRAQRGPVN